MKKLLVLFISSFFALTACGDMGPYNERKDLVQQCFDTGGTPLFTADKEGDIRIYFGCRRD